MSSTSQPLIFMIRHGEKPPKVNGEDPPGLSTQGQARAKGLVEIFGKESKYNIGLILSQAFNEKTGSRKRPYLTVLPLIESLRPEILQENHTLDRDDANAVVKYIDEWKKSKSSISSSTTGNDKGKDKDKNKDKSGRNILICWEHKRMTDIAEALGVKKAPVYPKDRFDLIWTINGNNLEIDTMVLDVDVGGGVGAGLGGRGGDEQGILPKIS